MFKQRIIKKHKERKDFLLAGKKRTGQKCMEQIRLKSSPGGQRGFQKVNNE